MLNLAPLLPDALFSRCQRTPKLAMTDTSNATGKHKQSVHHISIELNAEATS